MDGEKRDYWFTVLEVELATGASALDAIMTATISTAEVFGIGPPRCEHGVVEGQFCGPCNKDYKQAAKDNE